MASSFPVLKSGTMMEVVKLSGIVIVLVIKLISSNKHLCRFSLPNLYSSLGATNTNCSPIALQVYSLLDLVIVQPEVTYISLAVGLLVFLQWSPWSLREWCPSMWTTTLLHSPHHLPGDQQWELVSLLTWLCTYITWSSFLDTRLITWYLLLHSSAGVFCCFEELFGMRNISLVMTMKWSLDVAVPL